MILDAATIRVMGWRVMWVWFALVVGIWAQGGRGGAPAGPLKAELFEVKAVERERTVSAIGTLRANESVEIVSELAKRVVGIPVAEGAEVKAGDVLFLLDDADLKAALDETLARLDLAEMNAERAGQLLPQKAISQQEHDAAQSEVTVLKAQVVAQGVELEKTKIRAPFDGRIGVRRVSLGALVAPGAVLASLQDVSKIKVDFTLPERHAGEVKVGQRMRFAAAGGAKEHEGKVTVVEPVLDAVTRSLQVRGVVDGAEGLFPGGFAEVELVLDGVTNGFPIPSEAIIPSARGQAVMVIEDGKARMQAVVVGDRTAAEVLVLKGLKEGDVIATSNLLRIRPGSEVIAEGGEEP
jgi:membrane fusion protein (multidrug efflux system)